MPDILGNMLVFFFNLQQMDLIFKSYIKKVSSYSSLFTLENKNLFHHESNNNHFCFM